MGGGFLELLAAFALTAALRPVFVLVHELGHASVPLLRTRGRVEVRLGAAPGRVFGRYGRVNFGLGYDLLNPLRIQGGALAHEPMRRSDTVLCMLAGPLAEVFAVLAVFAAGWYGESYGLRVVGLLSMVCALGSLAPHPTLRSDGQQIVDLVRGRP